MRLVDLRSLGLLLVSMWVVGCIQATPEEAPCVPGTRGCACLSGDVACLDAGLMCNADNVCTDQACTPGARGCPCRVEGDPCALGLACRDSQCVVEPGKAGGACLTGGRCEPSLSCELGVCAPCERGQRRCDCYDDGSCERGLACIQGACITEPSEILAAPQNPTCYTPCTASITSGDTHVHCPPSGLIKGCLSGKTCQEGSCVSPGAPARACLVDAECPDFQACIEGHCLSNCEGDADCGQGLECHRKVCRIPCSAEGVSCPSGQGCLTHDGQSGYCAPLAAIEDAPQMEVLGGFSVSAQRLEFSNLVPAATFEVANLGATPLDVTLKVKHERVVDERGLVQHVTQAPLPWLRFGEPGRCSASSAPNARLFVPALGKSRIEVCNASGSADATWEGVVEVTTAAHGARTIDLYYAERPDGQWVGKAHYFANFEADGLDAWIANDRKDAVGGIKNAFVRRWAEFKFGRVTLAELRAVLLATQTESWRWPSVREICERRVPGGACYLYDNIDGFSTYSTSLEEFAVPSGVVELPIALNLHQVAGPGPGDTSCDAARFEGRVETSATLHYPGNPTIKLSFAGLPPTCGQRPFGTSVVSVTELEASAYTGGRYLTTRVGRACNEASFTGYVPHATPWLVPGFLGGTELDPVTQARARFECRSSLVPFEDETALNLSLAAANPIPDGRVRHRSLELVDGALIDGETLVLLFKETFASFYADGQSFSAYGYMVLQRTAKELPPADFVGSTVSPPAATPSKLGKGCSEALLDQVLGGPLTPSNAGALAQALLRGPQDEATVLGADSAEQVHYLCVEPSGKSTFGGATLDRKTYACPADSAVLYFTLTDVEEADVAGHVCNSNGRCKATLEDWLAQGFGALRMDPLWRCTDPGESVCDANRENLRQGKVFYSAAASTKLLPLAAQVDDAFRFKARFRSRQGLNTGFTPDICSQSTADIPYCYDPPTIEAVAERVDCVLDLYSDNTTYAALSSTMQARVKRFLETNFAYEAHQDLADGRMVRSEGFDFLNAELLIMLGDDAYAKASASRFDLAGAAVYGFTGAAFEPNGINLSGAAGYEMFRLYQAAQYYQLVLDRFYALSPHFDQPASKNFFTQATVSTYLSRVIRASAQKAITWSEVAERYQALNRPDLARLVVERAYLATYLESVITSGMMRSVLDDALPQERDAIVLTVETAQRSFHAALLQMQTVYDQIGADLGFLGFPPDYIPFPGLAPAEASAFEHVRVSALQKLQLAIEREEQALAKNRSYETDSASFQSELTRIRNTYENQLATLCGTLQGRDGRVYPATSTYAFLNDHAMAIGDPCGLMGTGQLFEARLTIAMARADVESVRRQFDNVLAEVAIEENRVRDQCRLVEEEVDFLILQGEEDTTLRDKIDTARGEIDKLRFDMQGIGNMANALGSCSPTVSATGASFNPGACVGAMLAGIVHEHVGPNINAKERDIRAREQELRDLQQATMEWQVEQRCDAAQVDSKSRVRTIVLRVAELEIAALKVSYQVLVEQSRQAAMQNQVKRILAEQRDAEQMAINVEVARNDPNVRIYKNDAVLAADRTFRAALEEAYRATKLYEYYTSQTYGAQGDLLVIRMALHGEPSLEAYLHELFAAFDRFEEQFGQPDLRVAVISLRDDVLQIPRLGEDGGSLSHAERVRQFRDKLADVRLLDGRGYLTAPFSTRADLVSPLTRNHKVLYLEAEMLGTNVGDELGRVYLAQRGTSSVRTVDDATVFYAFPERTAVVDLFFNGHKVFTPEVYRTDRLRDRPLLNTHWDLVLNQRDERVNQDIDLRSLTDVRLYVYYTDFTGF